MGDRAKLAARESGLRGASATDHDTEQRGTAVVSSEVGRAGLRLEIWPRYQIKIEQRSTVTQRRIFRELGQFFLQVAYMHRVDVAIEAAIAGGEALRRGYDDDLEIQEKDASRTSIVTAVDLRSQEQVVRVIRQACPADLIIGEEGNDGDSRQSSRWYVDPLDGTTNYSHRLPFYCVSIAYCDADGVGVGVVYDPFRNDLFVAVRGNGSTHNGQSISVSATRELRTSLLSTQVQSDDPTVLDRYTARLRRFLGVARAVRSLGAPALALAYVSCGRFDAFYEDNMSPWDTLAGTLLIEEAGGRVTTFNGMPRPLHRRSDILATNGALHQQLVATMSGELLSVPLRS
jgi:myo-inositol-1(or 4)-monophosphatase